MKTREKHLAWCKQRALEFVDRGELQEAVNSMEKDLAAHPKTEIYVSQVTLATFEIGRAHV